MIDFDASFRLFPGVDCRPSLPAADAPPRVADAQAAPAPNIAPDLRAQAAAHAAAHAHADQGAKCDAMMILPIPFPGGTVEELPLYFSGFDRRSFIGT